MVRWWRLESGSHAPLDERSHYAVAEAGFLFKFIQMTRHRQALTDNRLPISPLSLGTKTTPQKLTDFTGLALMPLSSRRPRLALETRWSG